MLEHFDDETIVSALKEQKGMAKIIVFEVLDSRARRSYGDERLLGNSFAFRITSSRAIQVKKG